MWLEVMFIFWGLKVLQLYLQMYKLTRSHNNVRLQRNKSQKGLEIVEYITFKCNIVRTHEKKNITTSQTDSEIYNIVLFLKF